MPPSLLLSQRRFYENSVSTLSDNNVVRQRVLPGCLCLNDHLLRGVSMKHRLHVSFIQRYQPRVSCLSSVSRILPGTIFGVSSTKNIPTTASLTRPAGLYSKSTRLLTVRWADLPQL